MPTSQIRACVSGKYLSAGDGEASLAGGMGAGDNSHPVARQTARRCPVGVCR